MYILVTFAVLELDPKFFSNLDESLFFIVPLFIASLIWVLAAIKALKLGKYWGKKIFMVYSQ